MRDILHQQAKWQKMEEHQAREWKQKLLIAFFLLQFPTFLVLFLFCSFLFFYFPILFFKFSPFLSCFNSPSFNILPCSFSLLIQFPTPFALFVFVFLLQFSTFVLFCSFIILYLCFEQIGWKCSTKITNWGTFLPQFSTFAFCFVASTARNKV